MLDKSEKTADLVVAMKAAAPFEAELTPSLLVRLRAENVTYDIAPQQLVREVSYAGDEGGVLCHIELNGMQKRVIISLTRLQIRRTLPFSAAAAFDYQTAKDGCPSARPSSSIHSGFAAASSTSTLKEDQRFFWAREQPKAEFPTGRAIENFCPKSAEQAFLRP